MDTGYTIKVEYIQIALLYITPQRLHSSTNYDIHHMVHAFRQGIRVHKILDRYVIHIIYYIKYFYMKI